MEPPAVIHRPNTFLKQANKPFKSGRHSTKGTLSERAKGIVSYICDRKMFSTFFVGRVGKDQTRAQLKAHSEIEGQKRSLKNARKIAQQNKKDDLLKRRRGLGSKSGPPRIVGVVPLSGDLPKHATRTFLLSNTGGEVAGDATTITYCVLHDLMCFFV